eukprot:101128-Amphidinium_carterae.1
MSQPLPSMTVQQASELPDEDYIVVAFGSSNGARLRASCLMRSFLEATPRLTSVRIMSRLDLTSVDCPLHVVVPHEKNF